MTGEKENPTIETRQSKLENRNQEHGANSDFPVSNFSFLLEVGCEEIPARFLHDAEKGLGERVLAGLREARLLVGAVRETPLQTYSTPRRLIVHVPALAGRQPDKVEDILGPPVRVAVDAAGKYTRAAESFAQKNSARLEDLLRAVTPKGEYLALRRTTQGRSAQVILAEILPPAILGLSFPKSMYWMEKSDPHFVRPIRWVLAVLGEGEGAETVGFEILGVKSGNFTFGHRVHGNDRMTIKGFSDYGDKLRRAYVEFDREKRRQSVRNGLKVLLEDSSKLIDDTGLEEWIVNSTEWPSAIRGGFDERFLHLPREILITVMRDHQKYFAVENRKGGLEPCFLAILNVDSDEKGLIRRGHERVLQARFRDAEFFWESDQRLNLRQRQPILERVTYQVRLGSYAGKVRRMLGIAESIRSILESSEPNFAKCSVAVHDAICLCKCDLTTQMVQEFPELQGIVGGLYAAAQGEPKEITEAVYEHYLPQGAEDRCPATPVGAIVSLADKLDSVVGGLAVGLEPTGSSDAFGLRRQGNGLVKVVLEFKFPISLSLIVHEALNNLGITLHESPQEISRRVLEFLADRLRYFLETACSFRYDTVRAAMASGADAPYDTFLRAQALHNLRGSENLEALCFAAKRIKNILAKSASQSDWSSGGVDENLLSEEAERRLYDAYLAVDRDTQVLAGAGKYQLALEAISALRPAVDVFFDKVLVMAEDKSIRENRLRLLDKLDQMFSGIAHFSEIVSEGQAG